MLKEISIEIIRKCPNCCLHCSSEAHVQCEEIMPYSKFKEVISDAAKLGAKTICLSGGEPFLHDNITDMIQFVYQHHMDCYVYTSGIILDSSAQPASIPTDLLKQISKYVTKLIFNIEAGTEKTYNNIMGTNNCFEKMQQSVIRAVELGICAEAHFVPTAINSDEINAVIDLCQKLHISKLSFLRLVLHGRAKKNRKLLELTYENNMQLKEILHDIQMHSAFPVRVGVPLSIDTSCHKCEAANGKLNIKYDGEVFPCEVFKNYSMEKSLNGLKPDNIYRCSLFDIYQNSAYLKRIRDFSESFSGECETCIGQYLIQKEGETK